MKKVLVTGAAGFIGRHCIPKLKDKGYEVCAVTSRNPDKIPTDITWYKADLLDHAQVSDLLSNVRPSHILHLAWCTEPKSYWNSMENLDWLQASMGLLRDFKAFGGRRIVMAGTCAEYDWNYGYLSEFTTPDSPTSIYGACKHSLRTILEAVAKRDGFSAAWGRVFFLYGPNEHPDRLVSSVIRSLLEGNQALCSEGIQTRDYLYVKDVADAFVALLESEVEGPVNIASGQAVAVKEIINKIVEKIGREGLAKFGALSDQPNNPPQIEGDVRRLKTEVGWKPKFDLDKGLEETIASWKNSLKLKDISRARNCPVCQSPLTSTFLNRHNVPVFQNLVMKNQKSAAGIARGDLDLAVCADCGFIFNRSFDASKLDYCTDYDNSQSYSPMFDKYLSDFAQSLISEKDIKNSTIVEVGSGKGTFLRKLIEMGENNIGYGFDPSYTGPLKEMGGRLNFRKSYFGPDCADIDADVVICRHVIEHISEPVDLLRTIKRTLKKSNHARVYFETPTVDWVLKNGVLWDFFYEHCSYFNENSLKTAFEIAGYKVEEIKTVFRGQYLWLEAVLCSKGIKRPVTKKTVSMSRLVGDFASLESDLKGNFEAKIKKLSSLEKIALWGAGAKGVTFANLIDPDRKLIDCVVDINPRKQGRFIPGTGHPIIDFKELADYGVTTVILMNPNYRDENLALLKETNIGVQLLDLMGKEKVKV